jgi:hypothetical protein
MGSANESDTSAYIAGCISTPPSIPGNLNQLNSFEFFSIIPGITISRLTPIKGVMNQNGNKILHNASLGGPKFLFFFTQR